MIHASIIELASLLNVDSEYATYAAIMSENGAAATSQSMTLTFNPVNHEAAIYPITPAPSASCSSRLKAPDPPPSRDIR
jgi:hypothetical protein